MEEEILIRLVCIVFVIMVVAIVYRHAFDAGYRSCIKEYEDSNYN
jgi:hypothetical protein